MPVVLGRLAHVPRCARSVCCAVLDHLTPVHRCARSVCWPPLGCVCPRRFFCAPLPSVLQLFSALVSLGLGASLLPPRPLSLLLSLFFSFLPAPPSSLLFRCFRPLVPWASALFGCPPPPLVFSFAPPLISGSALRCPCSWHRLVGFLFLPSCAAFRVVCALCAGAVPEPSAGGRSWYFSVSRVLLCGALVWCGLFCVVRGVFLCPAVLLCPCLAVWCAVVLCC